MKENIIQKKSFEFALCVIDVYKELTFEKKEYVLSKQFLRAGTSIGANVVEGDEAQSKRDFISKMGIALKEARESKYWIELLNRGKYLDEYNSHRLIQKCEEIIRILRSIIKSSKENQA
ncbi:four helix bundle protein [Oceanirhabdus sp. W0125-5]|uniref:four helix bundle protein n=1 Tax=Oceanirhabdus sp. W0125-5 TaxID=2999116 RepID=UPI0022F33454|nr:four helix bundle protein [Oceanirhabdus sp. W0125-5]WBW98524.1 four helix bundle protein [Oceanirhabdus sp. W0125-5]